MSTLFPISELLMIVAFAAAMVTMLGKAAPRRQAVPIQHLAARRAIAGRGARSAARTEADFPSTGIC